MRSILFFFFNMLLLSGLLFDISYAQFIGYDLIIGTDRRSWINDSQQDNLGNVIFCANHEVPYTYFNNGSLIKVSQNGEYIIKDFETTGDTFCMLFQVLVLPENEYLVFGSRGIIDSVQPYKRAKFIWVLRLNENLDILWEKQFEVPLNYWNPAYEVWIDSSFTIFAAGECIWYDGYESRHHFFMAKFNTDGDTLKTSYPFINDPFGYPLGTVAGTMMGRPNNQPGAMVVGIGFLIPTGEEMVEIDSNLNYTASPFVCPNNYSIEYISTKRLSNSTYIMSSAISYQGNNDMNVSRMNVDNEFIENVIYGRIDTIDFPARRKSFDFNNVDNIYISSRDNIWPSSDENSRISIAILDSMLNIKGLKYYGGDMNYYTYVVSSTQDGGCVICGSVRDWQNIPSGIHNFWIKKVFPEDIMTHAEDTADPTDSDVKVFPNPGSESLNIETLRKDLTFILSDNSGKVLINGEIGVFPVHSFNTSGFNNGNYQYKVIDIIKGQVIETGSWIKK